MAGARNSIVASAPAAVTSPATWVRAPALAFTAVCEVPPPQGMAPKKPAATLAAPVASSSWSGSMRDSPRRWKARPAAMDSVKLIRAMPAAAGHNGNSSERSGSVNSGKPAGIAPTTLTPASASPSSSDAAIAPATTTSGAGARGVNACISPMAAKLAAATSTVGSDASGMCPAIASRSRRNPLLSMCSPSSFGNWSTTITSPMPALNPVSTGSEMNLAIPPRRSTRASISIKPTSTVRVAAAVASGTPG